MISSILQNDIKFETTYFLFAFLLINLLVSYSREQYARKQFNLNIMARREIALTEKLLNALMPPNVLRNLKDEKTPAFQHKDVTLLFADIVGFTSWSNKHTPIQVIEMLSKLFTVFDNLCMKHSVFKVCTIGDCYVVQGFKGDDDSIAQNRCPIIELENCINMAFDMLSSIEEINKKHKLNLGMRIGIHIGNIIAGVTGTHIVRYDIYGSDVSIAN